MLKPLLKVPSFVSYVVFITLALLKVSVPNEIYTFTNIVSGANGPIAMFMIGLLLEPHFDKKALRKKVKLLLYTKQDNKLKPRYPNLDMKMWDKMYRDAEKKIK